MRTITTTIAAGLIGCFALAGSAAADYSVSVDFFGIDRSGVAFFEDGFSDGLPPPNRQGAIGTSTAAYDVRGVVGPENVGGNGRLILNQSDAVFNNGLFDDNPGVNQRVSLQTNTDSTNTTAGLKRSLAFQVFAGFDLTAPAVGENYGIRLDDRVNGSLGNDIIDLRVRNATGTPVILFRQTDQITHSRVEFELPLDLNHDQIALALDHPDANTDTIFGGFVYLDGGVTGPINTFSQTFNIFHGELFTRASFSAGANVALVPEPSTYAMLLAGLGLLGFVAHRRKSA